LNLLSAFDIEKNETRTIAFTGAGGKSTIMYKLAVQLAKKEKTVLVTSTTMIFHPKIKSRPFNYFFTGKVETLINQISSKKGTITVVGSEITAEGRKIKGFPPEKLAVIQNSGLFDIILVEADGSKGKSIKAPAEHEPVIPFNTDIVVGIIGIDSLGTKINMENVHRPEIFIKITGSDMNGIIETDLIGKLIISPKGIFKNTSTKSRKIVILNKSDTSELILKAKNVAGNISGCTNIERIIITSMTVHNPVIAVITL